MNQPLWTQTKVASATSGQTSGQADITGISIDSRDVAAGDLFVALQGPNFDGHEFVASAIAHGAVAALVHKPVAGVDDSQLILVPDTLQALEKLGRAARERTTARILAVTGSCGKTSTKEALAAAFRTAGARVHASVKSFNNHWGVPLTLARMPADAEFAIFEIGMNAPGEIRTLVNMVRPHVAMITTVEAAHLEFFGSVEAIADAKAEIFEGLAEDGVAILPADNACFAQLRARAEDCGIANIKNFGHAETADARAVRTTLGADNSTVSAVIDGTEMAVKISLPGAHWVSNALCCLLAVHQAGGDLAAAGIALASMTGLAGRGAATTLHTRQGDIRLIDESYNANPASMAAALSVLANTRPGRENGRGRRIAVLGDMRELGPAADQLHADLATAIRDGGFHAFLCGPHMAALRDALGNPDNVTWAPDSARLLPQVMDTVRANDIVLVKGSLGSRMAVIVDALKQLDGGETAARTGE